MEKLRFIWWTKNINDTSPFGVIHIGDYFGDFTLCGKHVEYNPRWYLDYIFTYSKDLNVEEKLTCPQCKRKLISLIAKHLKEK